MTDHPEGYRVNPSGGPPIRTDIVDVYVFRTSDGSPEFLQLLRATDPLANTWHPIMGHIEAGETAPQCALRELREEVGLAHTSELVLGIWALEQTHPFYVHQIDCIVCSPRFAVHVDTAFEPTLDEDNADHRWVTLEDAPSRFMWPGQLGALNEIAHHIIPPASIARAQLRLDLSRL